MDNKETGIAIINMVLMKYNLYPFVSEFCDKIEIIESDDFYGNIMQYIEIESQKENVILCKRQFEYIDAKVIMPQKINRTASLTHLLQNQSLEHIMVGDGNRNYCFCCSF